MLRSEFHECPQCHGAVARENYTEHEVRDDAGELDRTDRFLYCDFCHRGFESSTYPDGTVYPLDFSERTEPVQFGKFLQRLEAARVA